MMNAKRLVLVLFEDNDAGYANGVLPDRDKLGTSARLNNLRIDVSLNHVK